MKQRYEVLTPLKWAAGKGEKCAAVGEERDDLLKDSLPWLLEQGHIRLVVDQAETEE